MASPGASIRRRARTAARRLQRERGRVARGDRKVLPLLGDYAFADLLVSCNGGSGGLFHVETGSGRVDLLRGGDFRGIALVGTRIFVGETYGLLELDRAFAKRRRINLAGADVHGLFHRDGRLYVCTTGHDSVTVLDADSLNPVGEIRIPGNGTAPFHHISSVWVGEDLLLLSIHRGSGGAPERIGAVLALDRDATRVIEGRSFRSLAGPHSVMVFGNGEPIIGLSRIRHHPEIPAECGVCVVRREDGARRFIPLPGDEVFEVILSHAEHASPESAGI